MRILLRPTLGLLFLVVLSFLLGSSTAWGQYRTPLEELRRASGGDTKIPLTKQSVVLMKLKPIEPRLNQLYDRFLEFEGYSVPEDGRVVLIRDVRSADGILMLFHTTGSVARLKNSKGLHKRISDLMVQELNKHVPPQDTSWVHFTAGIDTTYRADQSTNYESRNWQRTLAVRLTIFRPDVQMGEAYPEDSGQGADNQTKTAQELALERFKPKEDVLRKIYEPYLDLNGLVWPTDARLYMQLHEFLDDALMLTFELSSKALRSDPDLTYHRKLAEKLGLHYQRKAQQLEIDWLQFKVVADTSRGDRPPVFLF
jgi:hypothetical protein